MPTKKKLKKTRPRNRIAVQAAVAGAPSAALLRRYAREVFEGSKSADITLRIVGRAEGRTLNSQFRKRNYPTNVLSFPYGNGSGDIVLCHPVIVREAKDQGKALRAHYAHLVVHGVLHLRGRDHRRRTDAARMEREEIRILARLGFADPYTLK